MVKRKRGSAIEMEESLQTIVSRTIKKNKTIFKKLDEL